MIASIILALHLLGAVPLETAALFLLITGVLLLIAEAFFTTGILALNGFLTLYIGYALKYGNATIFGFTLGWDVFFGIAFAEFALLATVVYLALRPRKKKATTGTEGMIGEKASVIEWSGKKGRVRVQGEEWEAVSEQSLELKKDEKVTIESIDDLVVKIKV